jgi:hypothetical protein
MKISNRLSTRRTTNRLMAQSLIVLGLITSSRIAQAQLPYGNSRSFSLQNQSSFNRSSIGAGSRPSFSPYLNLLRGGNSTLANYYGLVRPELDFRRANSQLQFGIGQLRGDLDDSRNQFRASNLPVSGHRVFFQSDLRGGPASVSQSMADRSSRLRNLSPSPGSRLAPTGHAVYFGNSSGFYRSPRQ